jgi:hypothetical protein
VLRETVEHGELLGRVGLHDLRRAVVPHEPTHVGNMTELVPANVGEHLAHHVGEVVVRILVEQFELDVVAHLTVAVLAEMDSLAGGVVVEVLRVRTVEGSVVTDEVDVALIVFVEPTADMVE